MRLEINQSRCGLAWDKAIRTAFSDKRQVSTLRSLAAVGKTAICEHCRDQVLQVYPRQVHAVVEQKRPSQPAAPSKFFCTPRELLSSSTYKRLLVQFVAKGHGSEMSTCVCSTRKSCRLSA